ncbi:hypothetical protein [Serratia fonticola]|uniref:hypothetical protein n=1 Tax=Serratia fonticola TaxID=47917 RepID=UPI00301D66E8
MNDMLERDIQRKVLHKLYGIYPRYSTEEIFDEIYSLFDNDDNFHRCLIYLEEHGLIESGLHEVMLGYATDKCGMRLTKNGVDFIRDDGGLGAELNVQTIKFHDNTIIALEDIIRISKIPEDQKVGLISKLRELPADATKHLILQLLTQGVLNLPAALQIIEKVLR